MTDYSDYTPELQKTARTSGQYGKVLKALKKCNFCELKDKYIITETDGVVLTVNIFPYIDYQLILIPRRHITELRQVHTREWLAVKSLSETAFKIYNEFFDIVDLNLIYREGMRSQKTVDHLHFNLIPFHPDLLRWDYQDINVAPNEAAKKMRKALVRSKEQRVKSKDKKLKRTF